MKKYIFITDFDGTMTEKDFYSIIIDDYIGDAGRDFHRTWVKENKVDIPFLNKIFAWHEFDEEELEEVLMKVKIDPYTPDLVRFLQENQGDFLILSAGFNYYIEKALKREGLGALKLITNEGVYENNVFVIKPDTTKIYYSEIYGVDKEKVVLDHKKAYETIFFAGDSEPDFKAAMAADVVFAKGDLKRLLKAAAKPFYPFEQYNEVIKQLKEVILNDKGLD